MSLWCRQNQLGALGLALNATVLWNTMYIDKAVTQLQAAGRPLVDELLAALSPLIFDHINFNGRYSFPRPERGELRPLRDLDADDDL